MNNKKISPLMRIFYFVIGFIISAGLIVYGISFFNPPFDLTLIGYPLHVWIIAGFMVIIGLFAGKMLKMAIFNNRNLD